MHITVGELIDRLSIFDRDARVVIGGSDDALEFNRLKHRGDDIETGEELVQMEFKQQVYRDASGTLIAEDVV